MIRIGLRFDIRDTVALYGLAERVRAKELGPAAVATFTGAAEAARTGEPLIVHCVHPSEAHVMADGYVRYGVRRPAVEELTGQRPAR